MGGAQIDRFGNVNTTVVGPYEKPRLRLPGSGGANDIISLCRHTVLVTPHERRRFVPKVDFVTSPGWLDGGDSRARSGLIFGGVSRVVTDLGLFGFEAGTKAMQIASLHNLAFYVALLTEARTRILDGTFTEWKVMMLPRLKNRITG